MKKVRKSNIELLRIISIILIVSTHLFTVSGIRYCDYTNDINFNEGISQIMGLGGKLDNELFILLPVFFVFRVNLILEKF